MGDKSVRDLCLWQKYILCDRVSVFCISWVSFCLQSGTKPRITFLWEMPEFFLVFQGKVNYEKCLQEKLLWKCLKTWILLN